MAAILKPTLNLQIKKKKLNIKRVHLASGLTVNSKTLVVS